MANYCEISENQNIVNNYSNNCDCKKYCNEDKCDKILDNFLIHNKLYSTKEADILLNEDISSIQKKIRDVKGKISEDQINFKNNKNMKKFLEYDDTLTLKEKSKYYDLLQKENEEIEALLNFVEEKKINHDEIENFIIKSNNSTLKTVKNKIEMKLNTLEEIKVNTNKVDIDNKFFLLSQSEINDKKQKYSKQKKYYEVNKKLVDQNLLKLKKIMKEKNNDILKIYKDLEFRHKKNRGVLDNINNQCSLEIEKCPTKYMKVVYLLIIFGLTIYLTNYQKVFIKNLIK